MSVLLKNQGSDKEKMSAFGKLEKGEKLNIKELSVVCGFLSLAVSTLIDRIHQLEYKETLDDVVKH